MGLGPDKNYLPANPQIQIYLALVTQILIDLLSLNVYYQFNSINFVVLYSQLKPNSICPSSSSLSQRPTITIVFEI